MVVSRNQKLGLPTNSLVRSGGFAGGGITNARGIVGLFKPLAGGGEDLVDQMTVERMAAVSVAGEDRVLLLPSRFSLGFMLSMDNRHREAGKLETVIIGKQAFGHAGAGGSLGFADTECHLGFGYTMNRMGPGYCSMSGASPWWTRLIGA